MYNWSDEKVIVTGGAGFIGSQLVDALVGLGATPTVMDNFCRGRIENLASAMDSISLVGIDLRYTPPLIPEGSIVFHLASRVSNIAYAIGHHFDMLTDILALNSNMMEAVVESKPKLFVFVSTVCVYPCGCQIPTPEHAADICNPEETNRGYAIAKWVGEQQAAYIHRYFDIPVLTVRLTNAVGLRDHYDWATSHVVPALIRRVMEGEDPLSVWGTGTQTRAFIDARDVATALIKLAENGEAHDACAVNIGSSREISIGDLAHMIVSACGLDTTVQFDTSRPDGHKRRASDITRLEKLAGWTPGISLEQTLEDMMKDYLYQKEMGWIDE